MDIRAELVRIFGLDSDDQVELQAESYDDTGFLSFRRGATIRKLKSSEEIHVFVKISDPKRTELTTDFQRLVSCEFCRNECVFYGVMAPIIDRALATCQLPAVYPRAYAQQFGANGSLLVMEDLRHRGYRLLDRTQVTLEEAQCVVKAMAQLQAAFWVARRSFDNTMDDAIFGWDSPFSNPLAKANESKGLSLKLIFAACAEHFKATFASLLQDKEDEAIVLDALDGMMETLAMEADGSVPKDRRKPMGLRQGDFWSSNVMFKGSGESLSCKIFDWQFFGIDLFGIEIVQFMIAGLPPELFAKEIDNLQTLYYATFKEIFEAKTGESVPFSEEEAASILPEAFHVAFFWVIVTSLVAFTSGALDPRLVVANLVHVLKHRLRKSPYL